MMVGQSLVALTDQGNAIIAAVAERLTTAGIRCLYVEEQDEPARADVQVLVAGGITPVSDQLLARLPALRLVVRTGAGYDHVDLAALRRRGIGLVAPRLTGDTSVGEYVIGATIYLSRRLADADEAARRGDYDYRFRTLCWGLHGRRMGVVGMGRIGTQVAAMASSLGMHVSAWHPWSDRPLGVQRHEDFDTFLADSDVVTLHCRLTSATRHLVDASALRAMNSWAILVNAARGGIVDEQALADALHAGTIAGAAVDTFADEPAIADSQLQDAPNTLLSPHMAGLTRQSVGQLADFVADTTRGFLADGGMPPSHVVVPVGLSDAQTQKPSMRTNST